MNEHGKQYKISDFEADHRYAAQLSTQACFLKQCDILFVIQLPIYLHFPLVMKAETLFEFYFAYESWNICL